jgi:peptidyl-prolyl cis-trans isomerase A (cyclophilin A)
MKKTFFLLLAALCIILIHGNTVTAVENPQVIFSTTKGDLTIELYANKAPISVRNFLAYVDNGFYDGVIFHRVIPGFVIQGGGFTPEMAKKPTKAPIKNEADNGLRNLRGTLSLARTQDINSATTQFFINLSDNTALDHRPGNFGYAVFGKVIKGMEVVDTIAGVPTGNHGHYRDVPTIPVITKKATRKKP